MRWLIDLVWDGVRVVCLALMFGAVILAVEAVIQFSFDWSNF